LSSGTSQQVVLTTPRGETKLLLGQPLKRKEDGRYLRGWSRFVDDIKLPGMLHAAVTRSPYAHAKIKRINTLSVISSPSISLILTGKELMAKHIHSMPVAKPTANRKSVPRPVLAYDIVNYQGEAVAFVVADTR